MVHFLHYVHWIECSHFSIVYSEWPSTWEMSQQYPLTCESRSAQVRHFQIWVPPPSPFGVSTRIDFGGIQSDCFKCWGILIYWISEIEVYQFVMIINFIEEMAGWNLILLTRLKWGFQQSIRFHTFLHEHYKIMFDQKKIIRYPINHRATLLSML